MNNTPLHPTTHPRAWPDGAGSSHRQHLEEKRAYHHGLLHLSAYQLARAHVRRTGDGLTLVDRHGQDTCSYTWQEALTLSDVDRGVRVSLDGLEGPQAAQGSLKRAHMLLLCALCTVPEQTNPDSYPLERLRKMIPSVPTLLTTRMVPNGLGGEEASGLIMGLYDAASGLHGHLSVTSDELHTVYRTELHAHGELRLALGFEDMGLSRRYHPTPAGAVRPGFFPLCGPLEGL